MKIEEPDDLELALMDRYNMTGFVGCGPLTQFQQSAVVAHERYEAERNAEYEREQQHGGRSKCVRCGEYAVEHRVVNERQDPTSVGFCQGCGYVDYPI